jgi:hypothetical protein
MPKSKREDAFADLPGASTFGAGRPQKAASRPVIFPTGPRIYDLQSAPNTGIGGPGQPPPDFKTAHNSLDEWVVYWACSKVRGTPRDPRRPPYLGGDDWQYQQPESPTEIGLGVGRVPGGSVSDFVFLPATGTRVIVMRVQTDRFHINAGSNTQMRDLFIRDHLRGVEKVIDIYSSDFMHDLSGDAACRRVAMAAKGIEMPSPIRYRTALRTRTAF